MWEEDKDTPEPPPGTNLLGFQSQALDLLGIILQLSELLHCPVPQGIHPPRFLGHRKGGKSIPKPNWE